VTPAIEQAKRAGIDYWVHEYEHDPASESFGLEAAQKTGVAEARVFKTLVVELAWGELAVGVLPVSAMLSLKALARAAGAKKAAMAKPSDVERTTGYVLGGVSPLGQKRKLKTFIDQSANDLQTIFVSGGRRGLEIELSPADLARLTRGIFVPICQ
jgi:Cys-tRNA(Pro)/Cys-tRNA(Cys) deacylase